MKRWAWLVAILYLLILIALTLPGIKLAFGAKATLDRATAIFKYWPYWLWLAVMLLSQLALLAVPVRIASRRPVHRGSLVPTFLAGGLLMGVLAMGASLSIYEFFLLKQAGKDWVGWNSLAFAFVTWCIWSTIFSRMSQEERPADLVTRECRSLFQGSILELLIAVPTHIVARSRDYCCAGLLTFVGLTMGVSVMLFSFGPALYFLFAARWRKLHPPMKKR